MGRRLRRKVAQGAEPSHGRLQAAVLRRLHVGKERGHALQANVVVTRPASTQHVLRRKLFRALGAREALKWSLE